MNMVEVTLIIRTSSTLPTLKLVELNKYASVDDILKYIKKEITETKLDNLDWSVDFTKNYTLSIAPSRNSKYVGDIKLEDGCYVYMQEIPSNLIIKIKE